MTRDWKQWAADKGLQKWFQRDNLIILVLVGILLIIIALPARDSGEKGENSVTLMPESNAASTAETGEPDNAAGAFQELDADEVYTVYLEERLTEALSQMADVGKVKVMITLKSSSEVVVEKEQPVSHSSTNESDSQGGTRMINEVESDERTVYRTDGSSSEPYVIKTLPPQIEGVLVVAEGAGSGTVNRTIVEIAQALFGVEAHKVKVVKMEAAE